MPGGDVVYRYDGSFDGFLCCVFESYVRRELPLAIEPEENSQGFLYRERRIDTDPVHAERVFLSLQRKISADAQRMVQQGFLTCAPQKELLLYRFIRLGYRHGAGVTRRLADDTVNALNRALKFLSNEAHYFKEFLRFSDHAGALTAVIEPKNLVLPLVGPHFSNRFPDETFLIYDEAHHMAYVQQENRAEIFPLESLELPAPDAEELFWRRLWKRFFQTIAVEGRINPRCQMTHMPKRYWKNMVEQQPDPADIPLRNAALASPISAAALQSSNRPGRG